MAGNRNSGSNPRSHNNRPSIPRTRFKMIVHLLSQGASRRTVMRQAGVYRLTVDSIAKGTHTRQVNAPKYQTEEQQQKFCPHCRVTLTQWPCVKCSTIKFVGLSL